MPYKILPTKEFAKDFSKLDPQLRRRVKEKLEEAAEDPSRYKHLHYDLASYSRLWIGKLRIIYRYDEAKQELYPEKLITGHKYRE